MTIKYVNMEKRKAVVIRERDSNNFTISVYDETELICREVNQNCIEVMRVKFHLVNFHNFKSTNKTLKQLFS